MAKLIQPLSRAMMCIHCLAIKISSSLIVFSSLHFSNLVLRSFGCSNFLHIACVSQPIFFLSRLLIESVMPLIVASLVFYLLIAFLFNVLNISTSSSSQEKNFEGFDAGLLDKSRSSFFGDWGRKLSLPLLGEFLILVLTLKMCAHFLAGVVAWKKTFQSSLELLLSQSLESFYSETGSFWAIISSFLLFILSEALLFVSIFWGYYHSAFSPWFGSLPLEGFILVSTCELTYYGSFLLALASVSGGYNHYSRVSRTLGFSALPLPIAGISFLFVMLQTLEFRILDFCISDSIYGCVFFYLTSAHFFHLLFGILMLGFIFSLSSSKNFWGNEVSWTTMNNPSLLALCGKGGQKLITENSSLSKVAILLHRFSRVPDFYLKHTLFLPTLTLGGNSISTPFGQPRAVFPILEYFTGQLLYWHFVEYLWVIIDFVLYFS